MRINRYAHIVRMKRISFVRFDTFSIKDINAKDTKVSTFNWKTFYKFLRFWNTCIEIIIYLFLPSKSFIFIKIVELQITNA